MVSKSCGTDSKIGLSFVRSCSFFNKEIKETKHERIEVKTEKPADSRIEMMGGGYKEDPMEGTDG